MDTSLCRAVKQNGTGKQLMHASHSHNYYFIKGLLPLAATLSGIVVGWLARRRKRGRVLSEEEKGVTGGEGTFFNLGQLPVRTGSGDKASTASNLKNTYVVLGIRLN